MKTKARKVGLLFLSLFLVVAIVGCPAPVDEVGGLTAAELADSTIEALRAVETVQFETEMINKRKYMDEVANIVMAASTAGAVDMVNNRMKVIHTTTIPFRQEAVPQGAVVSIAHLTAHYFVDGMSYIKTTTETPGLEPQVQWRKQEVPWDAMPLPTELMILWLNISEVELLGTEKIRGIDCFPIGLLPDAEMYWQEMMRRMQEMELDPQIAEEVPCREDFEHALRDMTIKLWVAKDTFLPVKEHQRWTGVTIFEGSEMIGVMEKTTYFDYNQPVTIELPPEAADAITFEEFRDKPVMPPEPPPGIPRK